MEGAAVIGRLSNTHPGQCPGLTHCGAHSRGTARCQDDEPSPPPSPGGDAGEGDQRPSHHGWRDDSRDGSYGAKASCPLPHNRRERMKGEGTFLTNCRAHSRRTASCQDEEPSPPPSPAGDAGEGDHRHSHHWWVGLQRAGRLGLRTSARAEEAPVSGTRGERLSGSTLGCWHRPALREVEGDACARGTDLT